MPKADYNEQRRYFDDELKELKESYRRCIAVNEGEYRNYHGQMLGAIERVTLELERYEYFSSLLKTKIAPNVIFDDFFLDYASSKVSERYLDDISSLNNDHNAIIEKIHVGLGIDNDVYQMNMPKVLLDNIADKDGMVNVIAYGYDVNVEQAKEIYLRYKEDFDFIIENILRIDRIKERLELPDAY